MKTVPRKQGERPELSPETHYQNSLWLREFAATFPGHAVCDLTKHLLDKYIQNHSEVGPKTRNERRGVVKMFLRWCVKKDWLAPTHRLFEAVGFEHEIVTLGAVEWNHELTALLKDFSAHLAAVELVQDQHFDGHPILFRDLESELTETVRTIENAVATSNQYLKHRAERDGAGMNGGACGSNLVITLESIKASANGQRAAAIAAKWLNDARKESIETDVERWEQCREELGRESDMNK